MALGHLLIKPMGSACNLSCSYCFYRQVEKYLPVGKPIASEILEKMIGDFLAPRPEVAAFGWQGGEPTLAGLDFYKNVVEIQSRLGTRGQRVGNALQTNGMLIDEDWAGFLYDWRFLVGLSIDGPQPLHDRNRSRSWKKAMRAAELLRKHNVAFNILAVLTDESAGRGAELYRWFQKEGFRDVQFIPCIEPAELGSPAAWNPRLADFSVSPENYGRFLIESFHEWRETGLPAGNSDRLFNAMIARFMDIDPGMCTFAADCSSYLVVERQGEVYPCDFFVKEEWKLGQISDGLHKLSRHPVRRKFAGLKSQARKSCGDCPWWSLCHGGCPKDRAAVGSFEERSPFCAAYKMFFEESVDWFRQEATRRKEQCRLELEAQKTRSANSNRKPATPGRNAPCPCGSGKKFKRCCGKS
jgi:serine-type anaerobic sulfatase-maturating enzyme